MKYRLVFKDGTKSAWAKDYKWINFLAQKSNLRIEVEMEH